MAGITRQGGVGVDGDQGTSTWCQHKGGASVPLPTLHSSDGTWRYLEVPSPFIHHGRVSPALPRCRSWTGMASCPVVYLWQGNGLMLPHGRCYYSSHSLAPRGRGSERATRRGPGEPMPLPISQRQQPKPELLQ